MGYAIEKLDIYVLTFVATQNGVSLPLIGLSYIC